MTSDYNDRAVFEPDGVVRGEIRRVAHSSLAFKGWRMDVCPGNLRFVRYFADSDYGGDSGALRAARMARAALLMEEWR